LCRNIVNQERQYNRDPEINLKKTRINKNKREKSQQVLDELKHTWTESIYVFWSFLKRSALHRGYQLCLYKKKGTTSISKASGN